MELYARFSYAFTAGDQKIEDDKYVTNLLNDQLISFLKLNLITEYRILNAESSFIPDAALGPGFQSVLCSLHIGYNSRENKL